MRTETITQLIVFLRHFLKTWLRMKQRKLSSVEALSYLWKAVKLSCQLMIVRPPLINIMFYKPLPFRDYLVATPPHQN